jgi:predicted nucleic acid-binding protein
MLELLQKLFGYVLIPEAVHQEVILNVKDRQQSEAIARCDFILVHPIATQKFSFSHKLDRGEEEAIILTSELKADYLLLDDKRAQKEAKKQEITFIPTLAVLLKAAQKGIISDFDAILFKLQQKNIFLSRELNLAARNFLNLN